MARAQKRHNFGKQDDPLTVTFPKIW